MPELPFSWPKAPSFSVKEMTQFADSIIDESHSVPKPAYGWWESVQFYTLRALSNDEALPLVDLVRQVCFCLSFFCVNFVEWSFG